MMRKIEVRVATHKVGSDCTTEIEVEDDDSTESIEEQAKDAMFEMIEWGWQPIE